MPKFFNFKVAGYFLYFTSMCIVECMHAHASDGKLTEAGSAKFFVRENGDTIVQNKGVLNDRDVLKIQKYIKAHYKEMYLLCKQFGGEYFYKGN